VIRIKLTPRGRQLTRDILPKHAEDVHEVLSFMSRERLALLNELLDELRQGLRARAALQQSSRHATAETELV
jgi:DNA-binding MarR family transcriptional regulator